MNDHINLRIKSKKYYMTAIPDRETTSKTMRIDVRDLALEWAKQLGIKPESIERNECEFILQSTLDYIEALESVLEGLQADPDTPDYLLEEIERVFNENRI